MKHLIRITAAAALLALLAGCAGYYPAGAYGGEGYGAAPGYGPGFGMGFGGDGDGDGGGD